MTEYEIHTHGYPRCGGCSARPSMPWAPTPTGHCISLRRAQAKLQKAWPGVRASQVTVCLEGGALERARKEVEAQVRASQVTVCLEGGALERARKGAEAQVRASQVTVCLQGVKKVRQWHL